MRESSSKSDEGLVTRLSSPYLSEDRTLQFFTSVLVVLPVFLQAPWAHFSPLSACIFTVVIFLLGIAFDQLGGEKWFSIASLLIGVSGSWLGGSLFWGWLRQYPILHIPVEAVALPIALIGLSTRWKLGAVFYLACLFGTACTDLMMLFTGVINLWPDVVIASLEEAPELLHQAAQSLFNLQSGLLLFFAALFLVILAVFMRRKAKSSVPRGQVWLVASAALSTTLWVDALFLVTAFFEPRFSGLI